MLQCGGMRACCVRFAGTCSPQRPKLWDVNAAGLLRLRLPTLNAATTRCRCLCRDQHAAQHTACRRGVQRGGFEGRCGDLEGQKGMRLGSCACGTDAAVLAAGCLLLRPPTLGPPLLNFDACSRKACSARAAGCSPSYSSTAQPFCLHTPKRWRQRWQAAPAPAAPAPAAAAVAVPGSVCLWMRQSAGAFLARLQAH